MKFAILSGPMPPRISGVGDYTAKLSLELQHQGHEVRIWTAESEVSDNFRNFVFTLKQPWNRQSLRTLFIQMTGWGADFLIIQYTPQSLASSRLGSRIGNTLGINLGLPFNLARFKVKYRVPTVTLFHELNYPVGLTLRGIILGIPQFVQMLLMVLVSDFSFFTTENFLQKVRTYLPFKKNISWLPVGANIEEDLSSQIEIEKKKLREEKLILNPKWVLLHFGGMHPTHLYAEMIQSLKYINDTCGNGTACLVFVGITRSQLETAFPLQCQDSSIVKNIVTTGVLAESEVSKWISLSDLILAPFLDGVSTRRGSVMSALAHGKPVLTTLSNSSRSEVPWSRICVTVPVGDLYSYAQFALTLLMDPVTLKRLGESAREAYHQYFSWRVIARDLVTELKTFQKCGGF